MAINILKMCIRDRGMAAVIGVPFVLGSDAHSVADIENVWG